jgi:hypothetical protein
MNHLVTRHLLPLLQQKNKKSTEDTTTNSAKGTKAAKKHRRSAGDLSGFILSDPEDLSGSKRTRVKRSVFQFQQLGGDRRTVPRTVPQNGSLPAAETSEGSRASVDAAAAAAAGSSGSTGGSDSAAAAGGIDSSGAAKG